MSSRHTRSFFGVMLAVVFALAGIGVAVYGVLLWAAVAGLRN